MPGDPRAGGRERVAVGDAGAAHIELAAVNRPERLITAQHFTAVVGRFPGLERGQNLRGEGFVDFVEVEVL